MITQSMLDAAIEILPSTGEIDFEEYKETLYAAYPEDGKEIFTSLLKSRAFKKRLELNVAQGVKVVWLSRR